MKNTLARVLIIFIGLLSTFNKTFCQPRTTSETRHAIDIVEKQFKTYGPQSSEWNFISQRYPVYKIGGDYYLAFLAKKNSIFQISEFTSLNMRIGSQIGDIITVRVPVENLSTIYSLTGISYIEVAAQIFPDLDKVLFDTRVDSVHQGINLPEIYNGTNVLIGVADWGFDYTHPMFYDTLLSQTRILSAWDQNKTSGPSPASYTFGTEYTGSAALLTAQSDTANSQGKIFHATHVAGIAGGSGGGTIYRGIAYQAEFLFVTLGSNIAGGLDGLSWMKDKADALGRRLVINESFGGYDGSPLDGTSLQSQAMETLISQGVVFSTSAGNCGGSNFHIRHSFDNDTIKSRLGFYVYSDTSYWGEDVIMWGEPGRSISAQYQILNSSNVLIGQSPWFSTSVDTNYVDSSFVVGSDTLYYELAADNASPLNGCPNMAYRIKNTNTSYKVVLVATSDTGTVHFWNVREKNYGHSNTGMAFTSLGAGYVGGNDSYGVGNPGVTTNTITVASHNPEYLNGLGNVVGGAGSTFSSRGPIINGNMKPDVSGPGGNICSSISAFTTSAYTTTTTVLFNSINYPFGKISGTSMSAPAVTGVIALILDANPLLTTQEVKDIIMLSAREDSYTGNIPDSGSVIWGQGKLNAYLAIAMAANVLNVNTYTQQGWVAFPNPTQDQLFLLSNKNEDVLYHLEIYSLDGKLIQTGKYQWNLPIDVCSLPSGMYVIRISSESDSYQTRFIKN